MIEIAARDENQALGPTERIIDLEGAISKEDIAARMALVLKGASYDHDVSRPNLDMLQELVEDWFSANWGKDVRIRIIGIKELLRRETDLGLELIGMLFRAEMWTVEQRIRGNPQENNMTAYLSLRIILA
jgi:hypothetical protein